MAVGLTLILGLVTLEPSIDFFQKPSQSLLIGISGVGGTIYIAYIVGMAGLLRETKVRSGERANFVGAITAFGISGLFAIGILFALAGQDGRPLRWIQEYGFACASISLFCLGTMVGSLPLVAYDSVRSEHINPDE